jgi:hypothetical protein
MTPEEHGEVLDGRLQVALSEFDEMLLAQQRALEEKQREDPVPGREEAAGAGGEGSGGAMAGGRDPRSGGREAGTRGGAQGADTSSGGSPDAGGREGGDASTGGIEGQGGQGDPRVPSDVGDGRDDDVVARQLREAAMEEEDPELREKLWDEYRKYKKSAGS